MISSDELMADDKLSKLYDIASERIDLPREYIKLIHTKDELRDVADKTLIQAGITQGSRIYLVRRMQGGQ